MALPKMSIGSWAFSFGPFESDPWPFSKFLKYAAETGFDGVELNGFRPHPHPDDYDTPEKCAELVNEISGLGLGVSGYGPDFRAVPPAEVETGDYLDMLNKCLFFCEQCGIKTLRIDSVSPPLEMSPEKYEEMFTRLVKTWHAAAERCAESSVLLVWEFEPGFWLNKPSEVKRTVQAVGHDNFKVLFDTSHAYMGAVIGSRHTVGKEILSGGVAEYADMLSEYVGHLHLIDSDGTLHDDETSTHTPFGEGYINFPESLKPVVPVLRNLEWWCADYCFCAETETAARKAPDIMRNLAKEIL